LSVPGPFTTRRRKGSLYHEPHLPRQRDDFTLRYIASFWSSYISLPMTGIMLIVMGLLLAAFEGALIEMMRAATFEVGSASFIPQKIMSYTGAVFVAKGFYNFLNR